MRLRSFDLLALVFLLACGVALWAPAVAAVEKPPPASRAVHQGPILDPKTGSYFELRVDNGEGNAEDNWNGASAKASRLTYDGRRGHLAIVRTMETLEFIRENFRINEEVWIGLRFFCKYRKLLWVNGDIHPMARNELWARQWFRNAKVRCSTQHIDVMPVYLTRESHGPARWQAF